MRPLIRLHQPRRIASALLFVWLFAVFASWANACLVRPVVQAARAGGQHGLAHAASSHADAHLPAAHGASHDPDPAQEVCADFCDTGQSVVANPQPSKGDGTAEPVLFPPPTHAAWPAFSAGPHDRPWRPLAAPPPPGLPVAIAFLRLTL
jgi:hypothetical protein